MADTELTTDLMPLEASQFEITKIEELQKWHERLLHEKAENGRNEEKTLDVSLVNAFLEALTDAGAVIQYPENRSQLRALILYWSKFIEERTGTFPFYQLKPFDEPQLMKEMAEAVEAEQSTVNRSITKYTQMTDFSVALRERTQELERVRHLLNQRDIELRRTIEELNALYTQYEVLRERYRNTEVVLAQKDRVTTKRSRTEKIQAILVSILYLLSSVLASSGTNLLTSNSPNPVGWVIITLAIFAYLIATLMTTLLFIGVNR